MIELRKYTGTSKLLFVLAKQKTYNSITKPHGETNRTYTNTSGIYGVVGMTSTFFPTKQYKIGMGFRLSVGDISSSVHDYSMGVINTAFLAAF